MDAPPVSRRVAAVQAPVIPVIAQWIREHPGTISLGQGVVHYPPPATVYDAARRIAAEPDLHRYQNVHGLPELVAALERKLAAENGIDVAAGSRVVVTAGGNMAFLEAVMAIADPGDEVILPAPYYFNQQMALALCNCRAVPVPTTPDYGLDLAAIERAIGPRTRAVVTVSPNNPTGAVYDEASLRAVSALCRARGLYHVSDEAYEYFVYDGARHYSPGSDPGAAAHTISLYSLSKAYGLASWRVGYMVIPGHLALPVAKIQDTNLICPPVVSQLAALAALEAGRDWCAPHLASLAAVRATVLERLGALAPKVIAPRAPGAFYCLLRLATREHPLALAERLIREHRVAVIPGSAFGVEDECLLRVSYGALRAETVLEGLGRLERGLAALL
jgi:aspartate/methionine/tyrosine aminotransferase